MGHLKKGLTGRLAKTILFFLKHKNNLGADAVLGVGEGLQVPYKLNLFGHQMSIDLLQDEFIKLKEIQTKKFHAK